MIIIRSMKDWDLVNLTVWALRARFTRDTFTVEPVRANSQFYCIQTDVTAKAVAALQQTFAEGFIEGYEKRGSVEADRHAYDDAGESL